MHWSLAALFTVLIATAAILYFAPLAQLVGRRELVQRVHVVTGYLLPLPLVLGWLWSAALRVDISTMNRFSPADWRWLRDRARRSGRYPVGKFNAGQKLNAAFVLGSVVVMLGTGLVMHFDNLFPIAWRTGATFVHDWLAFAVVIVVAGHLYMALKDPEALRGMLSGRVSERWARHEHPAWAAQAPSETDQTSAVTAAATAATSPGEPGAPDRQ